MDDLEYDYVVIGSGFGGSVSALRLSEKGYKVLVIEKGKNYEASDFPKSNWDLRKYLWAPIFRCFGFQKISFFKEALILSGVGVGGGSLVYGNTLMTPPDHVFKNFFSVECVDWKDRLKPFYLMAKSMLGVTTNQLINLEDEILKEIAKESKREDCFSSVDVAVYFGDTKKETDPYFFGEGPMRLGCTHCAGCLTGCKHNAKNTLDKNYLWFAKKLGAKIHAETSVYKIESVQGQYLIHTKKSTGIFGKKEVFKCKGVIVSGGVLGSMDLLFKQKYISKTLPNLSAKLGENILTNSESLCAVTSKNIKLNNGIAISSIYNPTDSTHVELVKYPEGSNAMKFLALPSARQCLFPILRIFKVNPIKLTKLFFKKDWAKHTVIFLVMQTKENSMRMTFSKVPFFRLKFLNNKKEKVPSYIHEGQVLMEEFSKKVNGISQNTMTEVMFDMSSTAHILGGINMAKSKDEGVINERFEVFGYPNMYVLDGSIVPKNLGVNPSLTITALAEYAMSKISSHHKEKKL